MRASDLARKGWEGRKQIRFKLIEFDDDGNLIGCCALGALGLAVGIPAAAMETRYGLSDMYEKCLMVAQAVDSYLDCPLLIPVRDELGRNFQYLTAANDKWTSSPEIVYNLLDELEAELCHAE